LQRLLAEFAQRVVAALEQLASDRQARAIGAQPLRCLPALTRELRGFARRQPGCLDAYLVAENSIGAPLVGVVRKDGNVWSILQFAIPADQQSSEVFATRREAGARLMELATRT
jgi:hypothetical protein